MNSFFILGNVPSSKNGKRWTGKYLIHSKTTMRYIKETKEDYLRLKDKFIKEISKQDAPYTISFKFIRNSKRKFDYVNPLQTVQDLMVKYGWIEDDNATFLLPVFEPYEYNKVKPGVLITIISNKNDKEKQ